MPQIKFCPNAAEAEEDGEDEDDEDEVDEISVGRTFRLLFGEGISWGREVRLRLAEEAEEAEEDSGGEALWSPCSESSALFC